MSSDNVVYLDPKVKDKPEPNLCTLSVKVNASLKKKIDEFAKASGNASRSQMIRKVLEEYFVGEA